MRKSKLTGHPRGPVKSKALSHVASKGEDGFYSGLLISKEDGQSLRVIHDLQEPPKCKHFHLALL